MARADTAGSYRPWYLHPRGGRHPQGSKLVLARSMAVHNAQDIEPVLDRPDVRSLVSVVRGDGHLLDPEVPLGSHQNHFTIEVEGVAQAFKRNALESLFRVQHV